MAKPGRKPLPDGEKKADRQALKKERTRFSSEELACYASGSGALSFTWQSYDHASGNRISTGRPVTLEDARRWMGTSDRATHLVRQNWKLWGGSGGGPLLVADIERIGLNTLRVRDNQYIYAIDQTDPFYRRDGEVRSVSLMLTREGNEYRNIGLLSSVAFFLNHEKDLELYPPEPFTYEVSHEDLDGS